MELAVQFARATELRAAVEDSKDQGREMKERIKLVDRQNQPLNDLYQ